MRLTLGFSPCPNDTFIFDALVNRKIDTEGFEFEVHLEDVQTLNQWAMAGRLDLSKISYGVLPLVLDSYQLLDAGGALGKGVGPLLIAKSSISPTRLSECTIAIPGQQTTAHLLFSLAYPNARKKQFMIFSAIEDAVLSGEVDCGVIIHENRFTYQQKGLVKLADLGEFWEGATGAPIPLGGILAKKDLAPGIAQKVNELIRRSLEYAFQHYPSLPDYVRQHSQEMDEHVMRQHIDLYVNNYSLGLGEDGVTAVRTLLKTYSEINSTQSPMSLSVIS
ncbi:1,4-dihydroxy-6-naphthoate synthase [Flavitalea sp. BT771]|uniref:1,4-dihydroxy-6-naphthoate synthase n=1 Tax=Flavitalea sp. BT771 TaxID=3063329 RepID=UPI0026E2E7B1|nr:1,4-dihydroxy-6-naphthoate synthase [Flavitalea sp. BT771]MDO6429701.1 1,4-dihydroxy-6-naphthoate synthase [Flavitalea sp. BT771]MDV6218171.1 1,4-dihydroxy-6-naphthoate synthase [Flavitalea sp. BT771]